MKRKGFTIVELLVVVAILGVLLGIISTAAIGAIKNGRGKRANAMRAVLEQSIAAYYAQEGRWPGAIESKAKNMGSDTVYIFSASETDTIFRDIVRNSVGANASRPLIDASALFVANSTRLGNGGDGCYDIHNGNSSHFCGNKHCVNGIDFSEATKKGGKHRIQLSNMAFGYQGQEEGKFCRFWIEYNGRADTVKVLKADTKADHEDKIKKGQL